MLSTTRAATGSPSAKRRPAAPAVALHALAFLRRAGVYAILLVLAVLTLFPLVWMLLTSMKDPRDVFGGPLLPTSFRLSVYRRVWDGMAFPQHFANSAIVTTLTVSTVVVVGTLAGYAFARFRFPAREALFYLFLSCMMIPSQAILVPMFIFLHEIGLLDTLPGLSVSYLGTSVPFAIFIMRSFFLALPNELGDAGKIDGCTDFGVFARIFLPLAQAGVATITIFQVVTTWNEFAFATTFVTNPDLTTLQTALYRYSGNWIGLSAGIVMSIGPILVVYLALQRHFVGGLAAGALRR